METDADDRRSVDVSTDDVVDDTEPTRREVGISCRTPSDCVDHASCIGNPRDEYTCMRHCGQRGGGRLCEGGSVCTPVRNSTPICYTGGWKSVGTRCSSQLECRPGAICVGHASSGRFFCLEACHRRDGGCPSGSHCSPLERGGRRGVCRHHVGAPCRRSRDCRAELTCTSEMASPIRQTFSRGYCTRSGCESDDDCPTDSHCRQLPESDRSICLAPCERDIDCRLSGTHTCLDADACEGTERSERCNDFRDGASLCVPPGLGAWSSNE